MTRACLVVLLTLCCCALAFLLGAATADWLMYGPDGELAAPVAAKSTAPGPDHGQACEEVVLPSGAPYWKVKAAYFEQIRWLKALDELIKLLDPGWWRAKRGY
jgi:hypothetical protein